MIIDGVEVSDHSIQQAATAANLYRARGLRPLPSSPARKKPLLRYAAYWNTKPPDDLFDQFPTSNIQLLCGRAHGLLAIDCDGEEAAEVFKGLGRATRTWISHSGGGGIHYWFRIEKDYPHALPSGYLWKGEGSHSGIERLCDKSLVMAPPSIHPKTGKRYEFVARHDPKSIQQLARCPNWILDIPLLDLRPKPYAPTRKPIRDVQAQLPDGHCAADDVMVAIQDKVAEAESWGLRIAADRPSPTGWVQCHAIDRPDECPSAAIHHESGVYVDRGSDAHYSFLGLAVAIGAYPDFVTACNSLGAKYIGR